MARAQEGEEKSIPRHRGERAREWGRMGKREEKKAATCASALFDDEGRGCVPSFGVLGPFGRASTCPRLRIKISKNRLRQRLGRAKVGRGPNRASRFIAPPPRGDSSIAKREKREEESNNHNFETHLEARLGRDRGSSSHGSFLEGDELRLGEREREAKQARMRGACTRENESERKGFLVEGIGSLWRTWTRNRRLRHFFPPFSRPRPKFEIKMAAAAASEHPPMIYRHLGRTGLKVGVERPVAAGRGLRERGTRRERKRSKHLRRRRRRRRRRPRRSISLRSTWRALLNASNSVQSFYFSRH